MEPFTDKKLVEMAQRRYTGDCSLLVNALSKQLLAANALNKTFMEQMLRDRTRVIEMDRRMKPVGRLLMVDLPPFNERQDRGAVEVYADRGIDMCMVSAPVNLHDPNFDAALEWELKHQAERFRSMPWEIGPRYESTWTRWITNRREQYEKSLTP